MLFNFDTLKALVVDDDPNNLIVLCKTLAFYKIRHTSFTDSEAALLALNNPDMDFNMALLDVQMPAPSGFDMVRVIRADPLKRGMLVIAVSAYADEQRVLKAGFDGLLSKPIDPLRFQTSLRLMVQKHRTLVPVVSSSPKP